MPFDGSGWPPRKSPWWRRWPWGALIGLVLLWEAMKDFCAERPLAFLAVLLSGGVLGWSAALFFYGAHLPVNGRIRWAAFAGGFGGEIVSLLIGSVWFSARRKKSPR